MGTLSSAAACAAADTAATPPVLPDLWRASELAACRTHTISTGHAALDRELPGGGWPTGALVELLAQQAGIGEMRLLQPALRQAADRAIALVQPPHAPQVSAWAAEDFPVERMVWVNARRSADALWAAEQILRNGSCGALLLWQTQVRSESLRRLHLAAQSGDTLFWLIRPLAAIRDASPAPLRLALRPAAGGIGIDIVKRRGPRRDAMLFVPLERLPAAPFPSSSNLIEPSHAPVDRSAPAPAAARSLPPALV